MWRVRDFRLIMSLLRFQWAALKMILASKVEQVCSEYFDTTKDLNEPYEDLLQRLLALLHDFPNAPFTAQRLCELLLDPHRIYATSTRKATSAIEKLLTVSSTVPVMQVAVPRVGTYQAASETELKTLVRNMNSRAAGARLPHKSRTKSEPSCVGAGPVQVGGDAGEPMEL